ncbi:unnamed protein product [Closterium sp. NIES-53]
MARQPAAWLTRDAAAHLAIRNHLPLAECAHFGQHRTTQALYDAVVARYSSPATAALGLLLLPYLFPELSAFATEEDLVSHLCTSDARYRAALPAEFLDRNPPPIVVAVGATRGTPRTPFFEGCSPSPLAPSYASAAAVDVLGAEDVGAASASAKRRSSKGKGGRGGGGGSGGGGGGSSGVGGGSGGGGSGGSGGRSGGFGGGGGGSGGNGSSGSGGSGGSRTGAHCGGSRGGQRQQQQRRSETPSPQQLREWFAKRGASGGSVSCPYVIRAGDRAGQTCEKLHTQHCCFSRLDDAWCAEFGDEAERPHWAELLRSGVAIFDLDYDAILTAMYALSVSAEGNCYLCVPPDPSIEAAALGAGESTALAEALHTFRFNSGASRCFFPDSTTLTPLSSPAPVRLADPLGGPVLARSSTVLTCPAVPSSPLSGSSLYTLATEPPRVAASAQVSTLGQVAPPCSCRLSHQTVQWHHRLGHPSLPRPRGMHSCLLVSGLPKSLHPLPPSPTLPCLPCVEGRQRATPHSSFPPTTATLLTLHMDVWGPARVSGQGRERYFLLLRERFRADLPVLRLHSDRGGEFSFDLLRDFCRGEGILQSFTLPDSPQQNGIAERRIGLVMEVAFGSLYRLFPYRSAPPPPLALFLAPGPPPVDPLPPQGPAPSGVSQVDPLPGTALVEGAGPGGAEPGGAEPGGAEPEGVKPGGAGSEGAESGGAEPRGTASFRGPAGASPRLSPRPKPLSSQQLHEWFSQRTRLRSGADGARDSAAGDTGVGGAGVTAGAGGTGGAVAAGPRGTRTRGTGAAGTGSVRGAGAGDPTEPGAARAGGAGAVNPGAKGVGGTVQHRPYFVPLLQQVLAVPSSTGLTPPLLCPPPDQSQQPLQPASPLPAPSPYTEQTGGLTEPCEPASCPASPV